MSMVTNGGVVIITDDTGLHFAGTGAMTFGVWVRNSGPSAQTTTNGMLFSRGYNNGSVYTNGSLILYYNKTSDVYYAVYIGTSSSVSIVTSAPSDLLWHHYCITVANSGGNILFNFYIDGVQVGTTQTYISQSIADPLHVIALGGLDYSGVYSVDNFVGQIACFDVYNRALSAKEIMGIALASGGNRNITGRVLRMPLFGRVAGGTINAKEYADMYGHTVSIATGSPLISGSPLNPFT